jgi:hypothetical protein
MLEFRIPVEIRATAVVVDAAPAKRPDKRGRMSPLTIPLGGSYKSTAILPLPEEVKT